MVQERAAGNGNFDIDAIRMAANAMENTPAVNDQPFIDPVADAFAADVEDMVDELRFNPSSNLAEEAQQIMNSPLAAKLGAGVMADLRAAVQLQEEKAANNADAFMRGDRIWEEQKEKRERDRKTIDDADDYADKVQNARQQSEQQRQQRAEAWANSDHTYAGQKMSAAEWLHMIQWFKQPENRAAWEAAMMARTGQSLAEVRTTGEKIDRLDTLIEKESRGETLSSEEITERDRLNRDRAVQQGMSVRREQLEGARLTPQVANRAEARVANLASNDVSVEIALGTRSDLLSGANTNLDTPTPRTSLTAQVEGRGEFAATAPSLRDHHRAALAATVPLDQPAPQVIANASPVAPVTNVATASAAGFDV